MSSHTPAEAPRGPVGLMIDVRFGGMFWGKFLSSGALWAHSIVAVIVVFEATGSALTVGIVTGAMALPQLLLSPLSGTWADRGDAARQMIVGRLVCAVASGGLATGLWWRPDAGERELTIVVVASALLLGFGFLIGGPAMQSMIPLVIRPGELPAAMALNTAPAMAGRIVGPTWGAFSVIHLGPALTMAVAAALQLTFALILVLIRLPRPAKRTDVDYSVRGGLRYVRRDRVMLLALMAAAATGFGSEPFITLAPATADALGAGTAFVGLLATSFGIGAAGGLLTITLLSRRLDHAWSTSSGIWLMFMGLAGTALAAGEIVSLVSYGVAGFGFSWGMTGVSIVIQARAPGHLRGRVMALWTMGFVGARPVAAAFSGLVAEATSVRTAYATVAGLLVLAGVMCSPGRLRGPAPCDAGSESSGFRA